MKRLERVEKLALQPGVWAAYRLTIRYHDRRARDAVATVTRSGVDGVQVEVVFRRLFEDKPFISKMRQADYEEMVAELLLLEDS